MTSSSCKLTVTTILQMVRAPFFTDFAESAQDGSEKPVIRLFGVTENGNSVAAHVHNFTAYFYIHVVERHETLNELVIEVFRKGLNQKVQNSQESEAVIKIDLVDRYSVMNYQNKKQKFLKVYVSHPKYIS